MSEEKHTEIVEGRIVSEQPINTSELKNIFSKNQEFFLKYCRVEKRLEELIKFYTDEFENELNALLWTGKNGYPKDDDDREQRIEQISEEQIRCLKIIYDRYKLGYFSSELMEALSRKGDGKNNFFSLLTDGVLKANNFFEPDEISQLVKQYPGLVEVIFNHRSSIEEWSEDEGEIELVQVIIENNILFFRLFSSLYTDRFSQRTSTRFSVRSIIEDHQLKQLLQFIGGQKKTNLLGYQAFKEVIRAMAFV